MGAVNVYGVGNPLIDVLAAVEDHELEDLSLEKGTMRLVDDEQADRILAVLGEREKVYASGGSCPNTMNTLAVLGVSSALAGCIGDDELGGIYIDGLREDGVISDVTQVDAPTGSSLVLISPDGERTMCTRLGACRRFSPEYVDHGRVRDARMLHFTGYMWDTESQKSAVSAAIETARASDTTVVFDVADPMAVDRYRDDFRALIGGSVDVLFANRAEACALLDDDSLGAREAARELSSWCGIAAVKDGKHGSSIGLDGESSSVPGEPVDAIDTTGAGDNYAAGFMYGLLAGESPADAARYASHVAARIVRQRGSQFRGEARSGVRAEIHGLRDPVAASRK
ncbi:MAG: adenosine kinase [Spirochaetaceae bacterium]|nr:MAG: adenosine kinase [Spirochaetaceae bacterium]